jgi:biopolymer transport protein ExbD/biopolymer transport protein TolR
MNFKKKWKEDVRVDVTPLVDIVFNLLLFFMITTTFVIAPGIKVNLPKSKAVEIKKAKKELRIAVTKDQDIFFNQQKVTLEELLSELSKVAEKNKEAIVIIQADTDVNHGAVVQVLDAAKSVGLTKLAIATVPEKGKTTKN